MKVYNVGPDEEHPGNEYNEKFVWIVVDYTRFDYEGYGEAVALGHDGMLYFKGLDHCSCYGPFEELENGQFEKVSVEDYLKSDSIHDTDTENSKIRNKVIKLLGEKRVDEVKYVLAQRDDDYQTRYFLGKSNALSVSIKDATIMSLNEAKTIFDSLPQVPNLEIWSIKMVPQLVEKYDKHLVQTKIKALEEEIERLKKQLS